MNVVLFGATGKAGSRILKELLARGHQVTAVVRKPTTLPAGVTVKQDDLSNVDHTAKVIAGADAVVSAYGPPPDNTDLLIGATTRLVDAARKAGVPRLIVVGGAASLEVAPGVTLLASGHVPPEWLPIATSHAKVLEMMRTSDINWTYFSPAGYFEPGERTGKFRLGKDNLIMAANGQSRISMEDYAIALVDELEKPANERARFTIGY
ncbi:MAG: NAD(P)-dependent oxidoreductase [Terracidiphilus sp.]